ncbi:hypothetical protein DXG01_006622 [Tephrocybe rancida]|nr:hypothetical protein DXG01_006622 [Tephrocybe rancida]
MHVEIWPKEDKDYLGIQKWNTNRTTSTKIDQELGQYLSNMEYGRLCLTVPAEIQNHRGFDLGRMLWQLRDDNFSPPKPTTSLKIKLRNLDDQLSIAIVSLIFGGFTMLTKVRISCEHPCPFGFRELFKELYAMDRRSYKL